MFLHIGSRKIVSLHTVVGVFNAETINLSLRNEVYQDEMLADTKSLIIDKDDEVIVSDISSFTLIERSPIDEKDVVWKKR